MERYHQAWTATRLGYCNLDVHWSMWWSQSWITRDWGSPKNHKVQGVNMHSGSGGNAKVLPGEFYCGSCGSVWCNTVDHAQSSGGWPQNESGGALGIFDGSWFLLRLGTCILDLHSWSSFVLSEGMNRMKAFMWITCECVINPLGRR